LICPQLTTVTGTIKTKYMEKLELILPYIMTTIVLVLITVIIFRLFNYILQKRIIDAGPLDEHAVKFLAASSGTRKENLKWGMLLLFGGGGLLVLPYLPAELAQTPFPYGIEAIALAMGFISYYLISKNSKP
jgi:hypothetical protein